MLQLINIAKSYEPVADAPGPTVLRDVSLQLAPGRSLAITGPSGSGKTTLLNIIGTLDTPTAGRVLLDEQDLTRLSDAQIARLRASRLGFVFQNHHLLPQLTLLENVLVPTLAPGAPDRAAALPRARQLLDRVGLGQRLHHRPGQLSGGECQRVAVVRALVNQPRLVLADEPTGALDQATASRLGELLVELNREAGVSLIVVTHSLELAARVDRRLELREGRLVEPGESR